MVPFPSGDDAPSGPEEQISGSSFRGVAKDEAALLLLLFNRKYDDAVKDGKGLFVFGSDDDDDDDG